MDRLRELQKLRKQVEQTEEKIIELVAKTVSPKSPSLSDMPKGGRKSNELEEYIIKKERLENKVKAYKKRILELIEAANLTQTEKELMIYRFYYVMKWKKCAAKMKKKYPDDKWNDQKAYRVYRGVLVKINKL